MCKGGLVVCVCEKREKRVREMTVNRGGGIERLVVSCHHLTAHAPCCTIPLTRSNERMCWLSCCSLARAVASSLVSTDARASRWACATVPGLGAVKPARACVCEGGGGESGVEWESMGGGGDKSGGELNVGIDL